MTVTLTRATPATLTVPTPVRPTPAAPARKELDAALLIQLGFAVDRDGIGAHEDAAQLLVDAATRRGVRPILTEILADRREPTVARQRAFGRLAMALAG